MGSFPLLGIDRDSWDVASKDDLVAIKARPRADIFSNWFTEKLVPAYQHIIEERFKVTLQLHSTIDVQYISNLP